jgi:hypothetical protein
MLIVKQAIYPFPFVLQAVFPLEHASKRAIMPNPCPKGSEDTLAAGAMEQVCHAMSVQ